MSNSVKDRGLHIVGRHLVASAAEKKVTDCDERNGCYPVNHLQGSEEDSALGFPTPASLSDADSQDTCYVNSSATSGFSEAPFPPPSHFPQYSSSTQQPSPLHTHTRHNTARLQHSSNTKVVQSISYTTNSFRSLQIHYKQQKKSLSTAELQHGSFLTPHKVSLLPNMALFILLLCPLATNICRKLWRYMMELFLLSIAVLAEVMSLSRPAQCQRLQQGRRWTVCVSLLRLHYCQLQ